MGKLINTLKYGTAKAKLLVLYMLLCVAAIAGFAVAAYVTRQMLFFFGAVAGVFTLISIAQTLGIEGVDTPPEEQALPLDKQSMPAGEADALPEADAYTAQGNEEQGFNVQSQEWVSSDINSGEDLEDYDDMYEKEDSEPDDMTELLSNTGTVRKKKGLLAKLFGGKHKRAKKAKVIKSKNDAGDVEQTVEPGEKQAEEQEEKHKKLVVIKQASDEELDSYDKRKIKKTFHKYKVKKDHRMVLVDFSEKYHIKQAPAYIWVSGNEFHLLLIEDEPRHLIFPRFSINAITYLKKQPVNPDIDYPAFKRKNMLTELFKPCLPDYSHSTVVTDLTAYKNLYGIAGGIYFTNNSAKHLFDLLGAEFAVDDKVTASNKVNVFFKDAYKSNILLRDSVIDANGYADRISKTLDSMARSSISYNEFKDTLNLMIKNKLITQEFAMYYMDVRDKVKR